MKNLEDQYLGDGVYASFDGYHIILDLRAQGTARIAMEPDVVKKFNLYAKRVKAAVDARHREQQAEIDKAEDQTP